MKHFVQIRALIIASTSVTTGAAQVQPQVHPSLQPHMHHLAIFKDIAKCIFSCTIKCTLRCTPWLHCRVDYQLGVKCIIFFTLLCMFKFYLTSSAPLISSSNTPSGPSAYRSQSTTLGVPSDEPSVASSIAPSSAPSSTTLNASFLSLSYASSMVL